MEQITSTHRMVRFGVFELDLSAGELRKNGRRLKLQEQPFQVLASLLERPGHVVTREQLRQRLWAADTYVDFDRSLNSAVNRLREALEDSAQEPRFVETLPRRGYRFVGRLEPTVRAEPTNAEDNSPAERLRRARIRQWALTASLVFAMGLAGVLWFRSYPPSTGAPLRKFGLPIRTEYAPAFVKPEISPDGKQVAYVANPGSGGSLWVQELRRTEPRPIVGTANARGLFWSPDSLTIGFVADLQLKRTSVNGGTPRFIANIPSADFGGGTWSPDGNSIVISAGNPLRLYEIAATGGTPSLLFEPDEKERGDFSFTSPHFVPLPNQDRILLFTRVSERRAEVVARNLDTGTQSMLAAGSDASYSPTGHVVYSPTGHFIYREGFGRPSPLWAIAFSLRTLEPTGEPFQISSASGFNPTVALDGTLVYLEHSPIGQSQLVWKDRAGTKLQEVGQGQPHIAQVSLARDGTRAAVSAANLGWDIWIQDLERNLKQLLTSDPGEEGGPVWSPDGDRIAFFSGTPDTDYDIIVKAADGSTETQLLVATDQEEFPTDWSSDGMYLVFERMETYTSESSSAPGDLWFLKFEQRGGNHQEFRFTETPFDESLGQLSPKSRYIAYSSDKEGRSEIFVQPFPAGGAEQKVSRNGGTQPRWSTDGKELFYVEDETLMAVKVKTRPSVLASSPARLFKDENLKWNFPGHVYAVSRDGQRFLVKEKPEPGVLTIRVFQNWYDEFRERQQK